MEVDDWLLKKLFGTEAEKKVSPSQFQSFEYHGSKLKIEPRLSSVGEPKAVLLTLTVDSSKAMFPN